MFAKWLTSMLVFISFLKVDVWAECVGHRCKSNRYLSNDRSFSAAASAVSNYETIGVYMPLNGYRPKRQCGQLDGLESQCRPAKDCPIWYDVVSTCSLPNGDGHGVCCPDLPTNRGDGANVFAKPSPCKKGIKLDGLFKTIDVHWAKEASAASQLLMESMMETEKRLKRNKIQVRRYSSRYTHSTLFFRSKEESVSIGNSSLYAVFAAQQWVKRYQLKADQVSCFLNQVAIEETGIYNQCPSYGDCQQDVIDSPYRTISGVCNNVHLPGHVPWGVPDTAYQRALPPDYADGVWQPRRAKNGGQLPPPRVLSLSLIRDIYAPSDTDTTWVMQFGQFVDHDMLESVEAKLVDGSAVPCCTDDGNFLSQADVEHGKCMAIVIPQDDPFYSKFSQRCMEFARSAPACRADGRLGYVNQMNQNTHFLDLSAVYGSDKVLAGQLRTFQNGALNVTRLQRKGRHCPMDLPPVDDEEQEEISTCALSKAVTGVDPSPEIRCFKAGDSRINVSPYMVSSQTVVSRQHNQVAEQLAAINTHWDDERIYQETRRILIAQWQHIIYNEYVPVLIGREKMRQFGLVPLQSGFSNSYDARVDPSILNEFATAAFRFGHSLVPGRQSLINQKGVKEKDLLLRQHFFKTQETYPPGNIDKLLIAMATLQGEKVDNVFTEEVTNHLFEEEGKGFGMDLVSLNIQRGRDHGLPGYNEYRVLCGLPRAKGFSDLLDVIPVQIVEKFRSLYTSVDDIDLYIAGVCERPADGALLGPTFQCIVADQFARLKHGDRFFYDLAGQAGSFTEDQLNEIRRTSYARLICDNSRVQSIQPLVFKSVSDVNPMVDCNSLDSMPRMSLDPWREIDPTAWNVGPHGSRWLADCDFVGYDIGYVLIFGHVDDCARKCVDTVGCNAFWTNRSWCSLKAIPPWLKRTQLNGGICGIFPV